MAMAEKRKFSRLDVKVEVKWRKVDRALGVENVKTEATKNISRGGICITAHEIVRPSEILHLDIRLPDGRVIAGSGRVIWIKERPVSSGAGPCVYDMGIEFLKMSNEDREEIHKFVFESFT